MIHRERSGGQACHHERQARDHCSQAPQGDVQDGLSHSSGYSCGGSAGQQATAHPSRRRARVDPRASARQCRKSPFERLICLVLTPHRASQADISPCRKTGNWPASKEASKRRGSPMISVRPEMNLDAAPTGKRRSSSVMRRYRQPGMPYDEGASRHGYGRMKGFVERPLQLICPCWQAPGPQDAVACLERLFRAARG